MRTCLVNLQTQLVENVVEFGGSVPANCKETTTAPDGFQYVPSDVAGVGWTYDGSFTAPPVVQPSHNEAIDAQIDALETSHPFTHRYFREQLLAAVQAGIIPQQHPVAVIAIAEDAQIQSLRKQRT